jgi:SWI/SNF-related matrix-associated actin-dependent regulator of chromatin subfamily A-like protein 1
MAIKVVQEGRIWIARSDYADKDLVKAAGFRWNPDRKVWWTDKPEIAAKIDGDNDDIVARINAERQAQHQAREASIVASHATDAAIDLPLSDVCRKLGLNYLPYQRAGIAYATARTNTLIGDEMGLGKTIQAAGVINATPSVRKVLVVCPASLKINWERELRKWLVRPLTIGVANGGWPMTDVVIVNYDVLRKFDAQIKAVDWDLAIFDECHYVKNGKAQRTQAIFGKWDADAKAWKVAPIRAARRLFLTGTPILNRPKELWTIVHALDRQGLGANWRGFHVRYCAGHQTEYGWDIDGASNLPELNSKLRAAFMIRRLKSEVLTELPPKRRQVIVLEPSKKARALIERQNALADRVTQAKEALQASKASEDPKAFEAAVAALEDASGAAFEEMSALRHEIALAKLPQVIEHVRDALDGSEGKIIVFCHHRDVIREIASAFGADIRQMGGAARGAAPLVSREVGARVDLPLPVRLDQNRLSKDTDQREVDGLSEMPSQQARPSRDANLPPLLDSESESEKGRRAVLPQLEGDSDTGNLPAFGDSNQVWEQEVRSNDAVIGPDRSNERLQQGERLDHLVEGERHQAQRHARRIGNDHGSATGQIGVAVLYGETSVSDRQAAVDRFQNDPNCRLFVGGIKAAGVGITLTAATHVVFAEQDWTPGWNQQAEDRAHRIGQRESVLIQYVVLDGSLDAHIAQVNVDKAAIADAALDKPGAALSPLADLVAPPPAPQAPQKPAGTPPASEADDLTSDQIAATHEALRIIAGLCDGAQELDGRGFNKLDTGFGHDLASRASLSQKQAKWGRTLAIKYGRQIPAALLAIIKG